jgi:peptidyl-prolyl cis-trans isomerase C
MRVKNYLIFLLLSSVLMASSVQEDVAVVGPLTISQRDLSEKINITINQTYFHRNLPEGKEREIKQKALDSLIEAALMFLEAERIGLKADKAELKKHLDKVEKRLGSKKAFKEALARAGYSLKTFKEKIRRDMLAKTAYKKEVVEKVSITPDRLKRYYSENKKKFKKPETVKLQHILVKIKNPVLKDSWDEALKRASDLLKMIDEGADFADVAAKHSQGRYRIKGGHMGEVHRGRLPKEVETVVFAMEKGTVSRPVKSTHGYSIVKLLDKKESRQLSFQEIEANLKTTLEKKEIQAKKASWLEELKKRFPVKILINIK